MRASVHYTSGRRSEYERVISSLGFRSYFLVTKAYVNLRERQDTVLSNAPEEASSFFQRNYERIMNAFSSILPVRASPVYWDLSENDFVIEGGCGFEELVDTVKYQDLNCVKKFKKKMFDFGYEFGLIHHVKSHGACSLLMVVGCQDGNDWKAKDWFDSASGRMMRATSQIHDLIVMDSRGETQFLLDYFTPQEKIMLPRMVSGDNLKQISRDVGLANRTVQFHIYNICEKLGVSTQRQAVAALMEIGILEILPVTQVKYKSEAIFAEPD